MDGSGTLFGTLTGNTREILHKFSVDLPKKHGRGGQSAMRFARLRVEKRHNYVRKVAELASQHFIQNGERPNVAGIILAGSADFKTELGQSDIFDARLQAVVLGVVDVSYGERFLGRERGGGITGRATDEREMKNDGPNKTKQHGADLPNCCPKHKHPWASNKMAPAPHPQNCRAFAPGRRGLYSPPPLALLFFVRPRRQTPPPRPSFPLSCSSSVPSRSSEPGLLCTNPGTDEQSNASPLETTHKNTPRALPKKQNAGDKHHAFKPHPQSPNRPINRPHHHSSIHAVPSPFKQKKAARTASTRPSSSAPRCSAASSLCRRRG